MSRAALNVVFVAAGAALAAAVATHRRGPSDVDAPSLRGVVREEGGRVLAGAVVRATPTPVLVDAADPRAAVESTADASGAFELRGLSPGDWTLAVSADGAVNAFAATVRVPDVARLDLDVPRGATVTGTLVDETTHAPVAAAHVRLVNMDIVVVGDAATDSAGRFEIRLHRDTARFCDYVIDAAGYAPTPDPGGCGFDELLDGRRVDVALVALRGATLKGTITGPDGPVAGAHVDLRPTWWYLSPRIGPREATSDAAGRYDIADLDPGDYVVHVESPGLVQEGAEAPEFADSAPWFSGREPDASKVGVAAKYVTTFVVRMSRVAPFGRCTIEGRVVDSDKRAVAGAAIVTRQGPHSVRTTSKVDGTFVLADVPTVGKDVLVALDGVNAEGEGYGVAAPVGGRTTDVELEWSPPSLSPHVRGRVIADGAPIVGARVVVVSSSPGNTHCWTIPPYVHPTEGRTAADGTFDFAYAPFESTHVVAVDASGYGTWSTVIEDEAVIRAPIDVVLSPLAPLVGRVVRAGTDVGVGGAAVAVALVGWNPRYEFTEDDMPSRLAVVATTDVDGSFRVAGVADGQTLVVLGRGLRRTSFVVDAKSRRDARIDVAPAFEIVGRARFADGRPAVGLVATPYPADRPKIWSPPAGRRAVTDSNGAFVCGGLPAGKFVVEFDGGDPRIVPRHVGPLDAGARGVDVVVTEGVKLGGWAADLTGHVVHQPTVRLVPLDGGDVVEVIGSEDGQFAFDGLAAARYEMTVSARGFVRLAPRVVVPDGGRIEVALDRGLAVAGVVHDPDGAPVSNCRLRAEPVDAASPAETQDDFVGSAGEFRISGLTRGRWRISSFWKTGPQLPDGIVVEAGTENLELRCVAPPAAEKK
jgi:hypothetical protein